MRFSSREPHLSGFYDFILNYCGNYVITAVRAKGAERQLCCRGPSQCSPGGRLGKHTSCLVAIKRLPTVNVQNPRRFWYCWAHFLDEGHARPDPTHLQAW